ncbi:MAG: tetraacyldisaccharide 4'-kinase [Lactobacillaceae bacterium]|nr:tetraacyldisaccharide 4'-kinase [Lactobacillaceae bacterium]
MRTPKFWNNKGIISTFFLPLGFIYSSITSLRMKYIRGNKVNVPVICIGNLTAGGTGKTPVAISVAEILQESRLNPFFVSRGYGGKLKSIPVDNKIHIAEDVGDEPLLLSKQARVIIDSDRYKAAKIAADIGANIIIMDDGFQNPYLRKNLSFVVVDGGFGFGNERPIPAGPMRENLDNGLKRADAVIIIGKDTKHIAKRVGNIPVFKGTMKPALKTLKGKKVIAFAGIGRPQKFYDTLQSLEAKLVETIDFPDHHNYTKEELEKIIHKSQGLNAKAYTTSKDFVKIPLELRENFNVLEIEIDWENKEEFKSFILNHIKIA